MINNEKFDRLSVAAWAYLPNGRTPKGAPSFRAGAFVYDGATPPSADLAADPAHAGVVEGGGDGGEAVIFDGITAEYDGRTWYSFGTVSSFPFGGWAAYSTGCFVEVEEEIFGGQEAIDAVVEE